MREHLTLEEMKSEWQGSLKAYLLGFSSSLLLTLASFLLVLKGSGPYRVYGLIALALIQACCQLAFFLHVGHEAKPRWGTLVFYFMVLILLIIALGSLWIMSDLNDRVMGMKMHD